MRIVSVKSHLLRHELAEELGYSQQYYAAKTAAPGGSPHRRGHCRLGRVLWRGQCRRRQQNHCGAGYRADACRPKSAGARAALARRLHLLRDHGQKGMPLRRSPAWTSPLWDIAGKFYNAPLCQLVGGKCRERVPVYGYGMMLRREKNLAPLFAEEAAALEARGFRAVKMKIGRGAREDIHLVESVRKALKDETELMADANHCYTSTTP